MTDLDDLAEALQAIADIRQRGPDTVLGVFKEIQDDRAIEAAGQRPAQTQYPNLAEQKKKLRQLLDLPPEEQARIQDRLKNAALDFTGEQPVGGQAMGVKTAADVTSAETGIWLKQGCPTATDVRIMHSLKLKQRTARFAGFRLPFRG